METFTVDGEDCGIFDLRRVKIKNSILNKYDEGFKIIQLK